MARTCRQSRTSTQASPFLAFTILKGTICGAETGSQSETNYCDWFVLEKCGNHKQGLGCGSSKAADRCLGQLALDSLAVCGSSNCLPMSRLVAKTVLVGLVTACMQRGQSIVGGTTRTAAPMAAVHGSPGDGSEPDDGKGLLQQSRVQSRRT